MQAKKPLIRAISGEGRGSASHAWQRTSSIVGRRPGSMQSNASRRVTAGAGSLHGTERAAQSARVVEAPRSCAARSSTNRGSSSEACESDMDMDMDMDTVHGMMHGMAHYVVHHVAHGALHIGLPPPRAGAARRASRRAPHPGSTCLLQSRRSRRCRAREWTRRRPRAPSRPARYGEIRRDMARCMASPGAYHGIIVHCMVRDL
jgi:hypothetical protein